MKSTGHLRQAMAFAIAAILAPAGAVLALTCNVPTGAYPTIQSAVNDLNCSVISVAAGTYTEQVTIGRTLKLTGVGPRTVIKAPPVLAPDADGFRNIVEIRGGATVTASDFTVAGPGPGPCDSISGGIVIIGGALLDVDDVTVSDVRDQPLSDCGSTYSIRAGTQNGGPPDIGHLIASRCLVTGYQRGGFRVGGPGSTGQIHNNRVQGAPSSVGFSNGMVVIDGGLGTIDHNTVSGNQCNASYCGPDWFTQSQSFGIILVNANPGSTVSSNSVRGNDGGIDSNGSGDIDHNNVSDNRDFGLVLESGFTSNAHDNTANGVTGSCPIGVTSCDGILVLASGATFANNDARSNGHNGIEVMPGAVGNTLKDNSMTGNGSFDANDHTSGAGTAGTGNTWTKNNCNTSSPSGLCN